MEILPHASNVSPETEKRGNDLLRLIAGNEEITVESDCWERKRENDCLLGSISARVWAGTTYVAAACTCGTGGLRFSDSITRGGEPEDPPTPPGRQQG